MAASFCAFRSVSIHIPSSALTASAISANAADNKFLSSLFNNRHFVNQMSASSQLFENKEYITDVQVDTALQVIIEIDVTAQ